ncbi:hypothetical protein GF382_00135 [Candidatus Falkowbacteria bacterium]|nr:hypothetical protein [Candidatus Falkowbacteria bacterium]
MNENTNIILNFLNEYANLILVIITAVYAFLTYRMVSLTKRQIVAHIRISKAVVRSGLLARRNRNGRDIMLKEVVDKKLSVFKNEVVSFRVSLDIFNSSSGNGCIDQPKLLLRFRKSGFELELRNRNEEVGSRETIFMRGGDLAKKDLDYFMPFNKEFYKNLQKHPGQLDYFIKYRDNLNKIHIVKADKILPLM